ncbi:hypothetical protein D3C84_984120 [compost metagenome]
MALVQQGKRLEKCDLERLVQHRLQGGRLAQFVQHCVDVLCLIEVERGLLVFEDGSFNDFGGNVRRIACKHGVSLLNRQEAQQFTFSGFLR